jgi:hypothetical protein
MFEDQTHTSTILSQEQVHNAINTASAKMRT